MGKLVVVGISDQRIAKPPDILITYALGSCVAICLYDPLRRIGGLAHIMLPEAFGDIGGNNLYKFANTAIKELITSMGKLGCVQVHLSAKIAGGASMFATTGIGIGARNVETVKNELQRVRIRIVAEDTGANYGRTAQFNPEDGLLTIKTVYQGNRIL